jgi:DNA-directed RNA polymerase specialized sigma subunit
MARRELNVTQLAEVLGVSRITCSQAINHGLHNPTKQKIAAYLGIAA